MFYTYSDMVQPLKHTTSTRIKVLYCVRVDSVRDSKSMRSTLITIIDLRNKRPHKAPEALNSVATSVNNDGYTRKAAPRVESFK